ncbi:MAG: hypothetical protein VX438_19430, partial [Planctomycetota bacterium]|nr:hypothetical protein [Planctomycetota bacterium]
YGHWMNREDRVAVPWMAKFKRDPNPEKVVWRQSGTTHDRFYWLAVAPGHRKNGSLIVAKRKGQSFHFETMDGLDSCSLRLNDQVADLDQPISVTLPDGTRQETRVSRTIAIIFRCLSERVDPSAIYSAEIIVNSKK